MKIAITGDTHLGHSSIENIENMAKKMSDSNPDLRIHLGDIGESTIGTHLIAEALQILKIDAAIVGNHDLWVNTSSRNTSLDLFYSILPKLFIYNRFHYLEDQNLIKDNVAVVGSYLHYDYSAQDTCGKAVNYIKTKFSDLGFDEYYSLFKKRINNDGIYLRGPTTDKNFAEYIGNKFRSRLMQAEQDEAIDHIIIVTHVSCMPSQITRKPDDLEWSIGTPYFGNLSHVDFIKSLTKVKYVVSGHSHRGNHKTEIFDDGQKVQVINLDSDYKKPTFITLEI